VQWASFVNVLVLALMMATSQPRAVLVPARVQADTSIYIENLLWPHVNHRAPAVSAPDPKAAPRSEPAQKSPFAVDQRA